MELMQARDAAAAALLAATFTSTGSQAIADEAEATARIALTTAQIAERPLSAQTPADACDATVRLNRARHEVNFVIHCGRLSGPATAIHFHRGAKGRSGRSRSTSAASTSGPGRRRSRMPRARSEN